MLSASIEARLRAWMVDVPCIQTLGLQIIELGDGRVRMSARNDPKFNSKIPGVHGGVLAYVADCVAWFAIASRLGPNVPLTTTDLAIRYLNPCLTDVVALGRVIKFGRTLCPVIVELEDERSLPVAFAHVCYLRLDREDADSSENRASRP